MEKPKIAIVTPNTLAGIGLSEIIQRMMPGVEIFLCSKGAELNASGEADRYFHYFVSASELLASASFFLARQRKTIVLVHGEEARHLPQGFHTLNVYASEKELVRSILEMARHSHGEAGREPAAVREASRPPVGGPQLTTREREVLREVVVGHINKEIAARMGVSLATVISHRKNLTEKLGTKAVSALTIYAVTHGIVRSEEIG